MYNNIIHRYVIHYSNYTIKYLLINLNRYVIHYSNYTIKYLLINLNLIIF